MGETWNLWPTFEYKWAQTKIPRSPRSLQLKLGWHHPVSACLAQHAEGQDSRVKEITDMQIVALFVWETGCSIIWLSTTKRRTASDWPIDPKHSRGPENWRATSYHHHIQARTRLAHDLANVFMFYRVRRPALFRQAAKSSRRPESRIPTQAKDCPSLWPLNCDSTVIYYTESPGHVPRTFQFKLQSAQHTRIGLAHTHTHGQPGPLLEVIQHLPACCGSLSSIIREERKVKVFLSARSRSPQTCGARRSQHLWYSWSQIQAHS